MITITVINYLTLNGPSYFDITQAVRASKAHRWFYSEIKIKSPKIGKMCFVHNAFYIRILKVTENGF